MTARSKWLIVRKKIIISCLVAGIIYFILAFALIHFNILSTQEFIAGTTNSALIPQNNQDKNVAKNGEKTTTTTTPTPLIFFTNVNHLLVPIAVEKYDAMKVHAELMKRRISRLTERHANILAQPTPVKENLVNDTIHMFYSNYLNLGQNKEKPGWKMQNINNATYKVMKQNLEIARKSGAGVLYVPCSRLSNSLISQTSNVHSTLKLLFHLGPKYGLKVSIAVKDYAKRNVMSVRRDVRLFLSMYGKEKALYKMKKGKHYQAVIYVYSSFSIPSGEWAEVLSPKGKFTIRSTKSDVILLGEFQEEEHGSHIRQSGFDGFFTSASGNGDVFGSTWKNWQALATWAQEKSLLWSAGIVEVSSGLSAVGVALRTALRCRPRPSFVSLTNVPLIDEYFTLTQTWLRKWSNSSTSDM